MAKFPYGFTVSVTAHLVFVSTCNVKFSEIIVFRDLKLIFCGTFTKKGKTACMCFNGKHLFALINKYLLSSRPAVMS